MQSKARRTLYQLGLIWLLAGVAVPVQERPASERADRFVGTWILNVAKSTFEGAPAHRSSIRTFDYERDGMILCTVHTTSATGTPSFVHFLITLDGREYEEMSRSSGPDRMPTFVSARKIDESRIDLDFKRGGRVIIAHSWTISEDGRTFTVTRTATNAQGQPTRFVMVYEKQ